MITLGELVIPLWLDDDLIDLLEKLLTKNPRRRGSLEDELDNGWLERERVQFYSAEMICGLQFLHSKGIIHRGLPVRRPMYMEAWE
ncbi:mitogen-activated protein kinase HOG1-like [Xenopus laevis]|uniref:Mitogen-activated protein kinase HOG1-like n=1 Tax=Xenopus laevis TaxID=8355 RepID=A0A8J1L573_XENLA|nr:mitogen-activated protein kinase HOG1-like [Xenopus laevis]XP_041424708.1 mitogen-activated protein kinase HOG1-like [Xenopus laevis]